MRRYVLPFAMLALTVAVLVWAWLRVPASKTHETLVPTADAPYDGSQPLRLAVRSAANDDPSERLRGWLQDEVDHWLAHAPALRYDRGGVSHAANVFTLQLFVATPTQLRLRLIAPSGSVAREQSLAVNGLDLATAQTLARELPRFLALPNDWLALIGTDNAAHYEVVLHAREHLRAPPVEATNVADIDALEPVTREAKQYVRAWSTLARAYARMQGEDAASLDTLALTAAQRAIALDPSSAEAQTVRGRVQYRRGQWLAAHEQLLHALQLQPDAPLALTALACLLVDAGHGAQALPIAQRAVQRMPTDDEAHECLVSARFATGEPPVDSRDTSLPFAAARVIATVQILDRDLDGARRSYQTALAREQRDAQWLNALMDAASERSHIVEALRVITSAASEHRIDPTTEVLAGVALRRSDFVFNRLLRLQKAQEYAPLHVLWLPQAKTLRKHARFDDAIRAADLATFWARHGKPDICASEPGIAVCR